MIRFMKAVPFLSLSLSTMLLLAGCAGTPQTPAPASQSKSAPAAPAAPARPAVTRTYAVTFDAAGNARGADGQAVTREWVVAQLTNGKLDRHTVIKIAVPQTATREQSIAAFARANQVVKIFELYGFESVLVALAQP